MCAGNNLYSFISNSVKKSYLLLTDVPEMVSVFDGIYCMQYAFHCKNRLVEMTNLNWLSQTHLFFTNFIWSKRP